MNQKTGDLTTPKNPRTRRLGLRCSRSIPKSVHSVGSPSAGVRTLHVQSDRKDATQATPETPSVTALQRSAETTNCRPYRLALSKRMREKMTKKRLNFQKANEQDKSTGGDEEASNIKRVSGQTESTISPEEVAQIKLVAVIEEAQNELRLREEHARKVEELKKAIETWKTGFVAALSDLQRKIEPHLDKETLLQKLQIPHEMLKYADD